MNFLDSLLQQYNFDTNTIDAPTVGSKEAIEEADSDKEAEVDSEDAKPSDQPEEEGDKSATNSSPTEAKEESEKEREEPPVKTSSKPRKKHIIQEEDEDEPEEEPPIPVLSRKGKEKIVTPPASEDEAKQVDVETRVTRTPAEAKQLLDIIAVITAEGHTADAPALAPPQQIPSKPVRTSLRRSSKRKVSTSGGTDATASPEQKRTKSVSTKQAAPTATPPTSPLKKKKKILPATSLQESPKDKLRNASKKR
ncbi:uncharacterized protein LOC107178722 [Citrus sinensis]|uniref:uncharacterized protein LOC107178722 n=1 Tax=Citrus sinensis TaxID=2711 RepID=UPI002277DCB3|nr:uncharacterized protein LOC107178722 [Citrus sinensis]